MRLIDADKIVYTWVIDADGEEHDGVTLQSIIKKMPTIDAVEVVRCKDCKRKNAIIEIGMGSGKRIEVLCGVFNIITQSDDFCSYGERKDEE